MKKSILSLFIGLCATTATYATDCELFIQVVNPAIVNTGMPQSIGDMIANRLTNSLTRDGVVASPDFGQFMVTAASNTVSRQTLPGPPAQTAVKIELTLGVTDMVGGTVFATKTLNLSGVGTSEQRAYANALQTLNGGNATMNAFVDEAKEKIIAHFDANLEQYLRKANQAARLKKYDEALYYTSMVPTCCKGYKRAQAAMEEYLQKYFDREGMRLLNAAKAAFAVNPNAHGAAEAYALLGQIDPQSSVYQAAVSFANEVKRDTKVEYDFEVHEKYQNQVDLAKRRIEAARAVGVAYGNGQKARSTTVLWH